MFLFINGMRLGSFALIERIERWFCNQEDWDTN